MSKRKKAIIVILLIILSATIILQITEKEESESLTENTGQITETEEQSITNPEGVDIETRFKTPIGFVRTNEEEGSFGKFVRSYPLYPDGSLVYLYNGEEKVRQNAHMAVFQMNLSNRDLQQCADSVMRMYAEYYWKTISADGQNMHDKIGFNFVNGFYCDYSKWKDGYRISVDGNSTKWYKKTEADSGWESFEKYLDTVFAYAGTLSMEGETEAVDISDMKIGDVFLQGGSPGHVVMVVDVCVSENGDDKAFLLAQGYMPAQQFHVLKNPYHEEDPWYYLSELSWPLRTPEYTFNEGSFGRPVY